MEDNARKWTERERKEVDTLSECIKTGWGHWFKFELANSIYQMTTTAPSEFKDHDVDDTTSTIHVP